MAKSAALAAVRVTALLVLLPFVLVAAEGENALTPPAGELIVVGLSVVLVFAVAFAIAYAVRRQRRRDQIRANR